MWSLVPLLKLAPLEHNSIDDVRSNPFSETPISFLKSIFGKALPFQHFKEIEVFDCPKFKKLPLDSNSAKEHKIVIKGHKELQWEDEATLNAFLPCFKSLGG
ncbi:hypothetical protein Pint_19170 [Pistacia integerrima]|uniref:Uncharacterized protein n=1 Tax=Pistacia integerrima TaxID=434235 RepID=A0ACC0YXX6_9ROSI|nr:hypothetical protein Pint_19170 [Pistacia integerrima]